MRVDVVALREWCDRLCRAQATDALVLLGALGLAPAEPRSGQIDRGGQGHDGDLLVLTPPDGVSRATARTSRGTFRELTFLLDVSGIDRHTLEDAMGPGVQLRRTRSRPDHRVTYRVVVPGAPFSCDLLATFAGPPTASALTTAVTLRRSAPVGRA